MENQYFAASAVFLIQTLFGLYILAVMLRLLLQWVRADFYNPISQFLVKVTIPPLRPLRRVFPGWGGIDLASVLLLIVLEMIEQFLINTALGQAQPFPGLALNAVIALLDLLLNIYIFGIIIQAILSWVAPTSYNPAVSACIAELCGVAPSHVTLTAGAGAREKSLRIHAPRRYPPGATPPAA